MLSAQLYTRAGVHRYRGTPAGRFLDDFSDFLLRDGYARVTVGHYVRAACHLGHWSRRAGIALKALNEDAIARFEQHLPACRCPPPRGMAGSITLAGARNFLRYLRRVRVAPMPHIGFYVEEPWAIAAYKVGPVASQMDGFSDFLRTRRYAHQTALMYLGAIRHLGHWMAARHIAPRELDDSTIAAFDAHLAHCRCRARLRGRASGAASGARRFLEYLRECGIAPVQPAVSLPPLIEEYCAWAKSHRGVQESSLVHQRRYLGRFLKFAGDDPSRFDARTLRNFAMTLKAAKKSALSALRVFVRFLATVGKCKAGLEEAIPAIAQWRLSSLPRYLPRAEVEQVIRTAPYGSRDRAVLLLLARLGLRRGDIVGLAMRDIDWKRGAIRVIGKNRREAYLPLPQDVGNAILAYLRSKSRPQSESGRVFMSVQAPAQPITADMVSGIVYAAILRAGIRAPSRGCHLLRHSAATRWLRDGLALTDIGTLLRHQHLETTEIYAKVDVKELQKIAQPWPGSSR